MLLTILLVGCQSKESNMKTDTFTNNTSDINNTGGIIDKDDYSYSLNDLVFRDYGTGVKLYNNSKLIITQLDLNLNDETAIIYVVNLENSEVFKLYDYKPNQNITYTPNSEGVFNIIAEISNGEMIDLTSKALIEVSSTEDNANGFILLK